MPWNGPQAHPCGGWWPRCAICWPSGPVIRTSHTPVLPLPDAMEQIVPFDDCASRERCSRPVTSPEHRETRVGGNAPIEFDTLRSAIIPGLLCEDSREETEGSNSPRGMFDRRDIVRMRRGRIQCLTNLCRRQRCFRNTELDRALTGGLVPDRSDNVDAHHQDILVQRRCCGFFDFVRSSRS